MSQSVGPEYPFNAQFQAAFQPRIAAEAIDIVSIPEENAIEVQADDWTLHVAGDPMQFGFIAIEEDPDNESQREQSLLASIAEGDFASLRALDIELDHAIAHALVHSGDALSATLSRMLLTTRSQEES